MEFINMVWRATLNLGVWQVPVTLAAFVAGGACMIVARRLARPTIDETGMGTAVKTAVMALAWIAGVLLCLYALVCVAAVFWPLFTGAPV